MSITLKLPIVVDLALLRTVMEAAHRAHTDVKIETFYRLTERNSPTLDCDHLTEVEQYVGVGDLNVSST